MNILPPDPCTGPPRLMPPKRTPGEKGKIIGVDTPIMRIRVGKSSLSLSAYKLIEFGFIVLKINDFEFGFILNLNT